MYNCVVCTSSVVYFTSSKLLGILLEVCIITTSIAAPQWLFNCSTHTHVYVFVFIECIYDSKYVPYLQGQTGLYLGISVFSVAHGIQKMLDHSKMEKFTRNLLTVLGQQASIQSTA